MNFTKYFIDRRLLTNLVIIFMILIGTLTIVELPRQDMPNIDFNIVIISTFYPGASPEDVEINVTDPIEDELEKVDNIEEMSSFSIEGMSSIVIQISPDASDSDQVLDDIKSAVDKVTDLPDEVTNRPSINELKSTDMPVIEIAVIGESSNNHQEEDLRQVSKDLESAIKNIGNVGSITKIGYRKKEVKILTDLNKMKKNHISFVEMQNAIRARNVKLSGGTLESFYDEKKIVTFSEFNNLLDVQDVIVRSNFSGQHVKISDIADVQEDFEKRKIISRTNGINSINLIVKRRGTTDVIDLSNKIQAIIEKFQNSYKDKGIKIVKVVDFSHYTKSLLSIVRNNAFIGFFLIIIALFIFLDLHSAVWVAIGIPLSILGAYMFFPLVGITTNQLTLITIIMVLGMLVDDAIVIAENIHRHQEMGRPPVEAAIIGTREMFKPVLSTILTTILCFVPIFFMTGILGKFVYTLPLIVILTLGMSLFESTTLLPAHMSTPQTNFKHGFKDALMNNLKRKYAKLLRLALKFRAFTLLIFITTAIISIIFFSKVGRFELFPTEDFDLFYITMETKVGTSLKETSRVVQKVEKEVAKIPPSLMTSYKTIVGDHRTDEAASDPAQHENWALITVYLRPASERNVRSETIIENLQKKFDTLEGFEKFEVREMQDGPPVGAPITVRLISDNYKLCEKFEKSILAFLEKTDGVYNLETTNRLGKEEIQLIPDYDYMARVGITAADLANTIRVAYDGKVVTSVRKNGEEVDFRIKLIDSQRNNMEDLKKLVISNQQNRLIEIGKFISFKTQTSTQSITHFRGKKSIAITGDVRSKIITSKEVNNMIREKFEKKIAGTPGIAMEFGGMEKETMESMRNFFFAFLCAFLGIYAVLLLLLNSLLKPFLIMIAIPFGVIGVLIAFALHGLPLSFIGLIGTLGMIGVVVNDSLVMVTYLDSQRELNKDSYNIKMLIEAAKTRLRPVLLTTITTVLGLLPTIYGWGGMEPFLVPMVLAMASGLLFATVITLILIPLLYSFSVKNKNGLNTAMDF